MDMNIMFAASDNNYTSGAFLSMVKLNQILRDKYGVNPFVVLPNDGDGVSLLENAGISYEIVPSRNWVIDIEEGKTEKREKEKADELIDNERAVNRISKLIQEKNIEIVHINTSYSYVGARAALERNIPFIWHIREFLEEDQHRKIWDRKKGYALMGRANAIIAISRSIYNKYIKIFPEDKLHLIFNGIDETCFCNDRKKIFCNETINLGIIGGVVPHKGQEELINACGILKNERNITDFTLSIVGKGKDAYRAYLEQLVRKNQLDGQVIFAGPRNDISAVLESIDILCICSRNEAFGRVTVEGMMSGCVIIGADSAGTTELLEGGKNGYLYQQGNERHLSKIIEYVISHQEEARIIRDNGQKNALGRYTAGRNAKEVYDLYKTVKGELPRVDKEDLWFRKYQ